MASETKVCPECAEEVKAAAKVCRFCGHRFEAARELPQTAPAEIEDGDPDESSERRDRPGGGCGGCLTSLVIVGALVYFLGTGSGEDHSVSATEVERASCGQVLPDKATDESKNLLDAVVRNVAGRMPATSKSESQLRDSVTAVVGLKCALSSPTERVISPEFIDNATTFVTTGEQPASSP